MKKGFTLIEMAVVLLIIGMLATLVLRSISGSTPMARDTRRKGDLTTIATYLAQYYSKFGTFPSSTEWTQLEQALSQANIVTTLPDDPGGRRYFYYPCTDYISNYGDFQTYNHFILRAILEHTESQAPKLFEGAITTTPGVNSQMPWNCERISIDIDCDPSQGNYCIGL